MTLSDCRALVELVTGRMAFGVEFIKEGLVHVYMEGGCTEEEQAAINLRGPLVCKILVVEAFPDF